MLNLFVKTAFVDLDFVIDNFAQIAIQLQTEKRRKPRKLQMKTLC